MTLSTSQQKKLLNQLNLKWKNRSCVMCGMANWTLTDTFFEMREYQGGNIVLGGNKLLAIVPVICSNCGNTHLINPMVLGILNNEVDQKEVEGYE